MINRILNFDKQDWKHVFWLIGNIFRGYLDGDANRITESWLFLRLHLEYNSKRLN